jgi:glutathione S-transferase
MRAHMALHNSAIKIELREVDLNDMPGEALCISPKATVPILVFPDGTYIDESWDIVKWALTQNDPDNWLGDNKKYSLDAEMLIETNDFTFKEDLDHYKYADRYPEENAEVYRAACEEFIEELEDKLAEHDYLLGDTISLADIGVFPFIRQFSLVDKDWFDQAPYPSVRRWLQDITESPLFDHVFRKHDLWKTGDRTIYI